MAINPGEDPKMQMFIWNNIFFSLGFDVRDHYKVKFIYFEKDTHTFEEISQIFAIYIEGE